ncbi:hypothetical protein G7072_19640 [Nocardioides sp. HDW12B]|uniref:hypothetical protein n=1 Tax=Nocardioides sp. HDW12B TaxID=2714939 RepID=UPI00140DB8FF|nr:hypothetical protein [Nocardioides sp. HDW12B]QIK68262.1 hypothetical protein G7072_19640 [Nocardioides sp. HDW12B]
MSGFVGVVATTPAARDDRDLVARHLAGLSAAFARLRGTTPAPLADAPDPAGRPGPAFAAVGGDPAVGGGLVADERGWTLVHGACHPAASERPHPVTAETITVLDGQCSVVSHDARRGSTLIATDRFAAAPVHVAEQDGLLLVASSALVLAAHLRPAVDPETAGAFLVAGYQFGARTHWRGVRRLEPGTALTVDERGVTAHTWWRPTVDRDVEALSLDDATDHLLEVATRTYRERLAGQKTWIDLTGGYDSRLMALLLERAGVPFVGNTRMTSIGSDVELAQELSRLKRWDWEAKPLPEDWASRVPGELDRTLAAGDARLEVLQLARVAGIRRDMATSIPRLLSAGGGEHLQYYAWSTEILTPWRREPDLGRWVDMIGLKPSGPEVVAGGVRAATRRRLVADLEMVSGAHAGEPSSRRLDAVYAAKSAAHFGAYRAADDLDVTAQLPFYLEPVFSAAFSVPRRHRGGFRLMRRMMERLDPVAAALETTRGGPALPMRPSTAGRYLPYYRLLGRKGLNKVSGQVVGRPLMPLPQTYGWDESGSVRAAVAHLVERGTLDWDRLRTRSLLSEAGVERLRGFQASSATLGRVLTLELALEATGTSL